MDGSYIINIKTNQFHGTGPQVIKKTAHILRNPKVRHHFHKSPPSVLARSHISPVIAPFLDFLSANLNVVNKTRSITHTEVLTSRTDLKSVNTASHPCLDFHLSLRFPRQKSVCIFLPTHASSSDGIILLDFITKTVQMSNANNKVPCLCKFLHYPYLKFIHSVVFSRDFFMFC